jgi:RNA polymerase sigma factor (sigma-70 family)
LIYNVARKAGLNDAEAQEAVQETVIGVAKSIGGFETDARRGSFKAWLLHQTHWRIADQFRKRQAEPPPHPAVWQPVRLPEDATGTATVNRIPDPALSELESVWDDEWQQHVMRAALERVKTQVSAKQFQMFDLHTLQGLSVSDAARALGVSIASVYMAKSRVGRLLRRELARVAKERR